MRHMLDQAYALEILKCLAHPVRLQIVWMLRQGEQHVCHLVTALRRRQPYVSQQLAYLRRAGLVEQVRRGRYISYQLGDRQFVDHLQELCMRVAPSCPGCLVLPTAWWMCPCPKCAEARQVAGLGSDPSGEYGISARAMMRDCGHWACVRVWQASEDRVATALRSDCASIEPWVKQLRWVYIDQGGHAGPARLRLSRAASGHACRPSCLVPFLAFEAASAEAGLGRPGVSLLECTAGHG